ncbi:MAG: pantoate--beta-alanine ligase [Verrucomicrobia bacterium]|nr:pantoate--beta-alanine ligase [Verrucomicrobiota bacterium]
MVRFQTPRATDGLSRSPHPWQPRPVLIIKTPAAMQRRARSWHRDGLRIAFVPTMGYLHEGHISLVHEARKRAGPGGIVVVSIYVNPTQFAPTEDLSLYPRDLPRDLFLCREAGVDAAFLPSDASMYPGEETGQFSTYVVEDRLSRGMEGASRPTHFRGVTTIVAKLFLCVQPDSAVFGAKDWQQAQVVRRMVQNLNFPIQVVVAPTRRDVDGVALSSRNKYLSPEERPRAVALVRSLDLCRKAVRRGVVAAPLLKARVRKEVSQYPSARLDYVEFFDPESLKPVRTVRRGSHMALAVRVGATRLIDNGRL